MDNRLKTDRGLKQHAKKCKRSAPENVARDLPVAVFEEVIAEPVVWGS